MSERPNRKTGPAQPAIATVQPAPALSSAERSALRAQAHGLAPVVMIGDAGLTDSVAAETDRALTSHGLIKVRVLGDDREARQALGLALSERLGCALVQSIGKLLVLWRARPESAVAQTPIRRRVATAPKKLAAEGKPAPTRRARPGVPRAETPKPAPKRKPAPRHARPIGPGSRTVRGAFDPTITPVGRTPSGEAGNVGGRAAPARKTASSSGSTGVRNRSGIGMAKRAASPARPPASGARRASTGSGTRAGSDKAAAPARTGTRATGSGRPGPRSRAGRRGP